jgi:hypothetical protein
MARAASATRPTSLWGVGADNRRSRCAVLNGGHTIRAPPSEARKACRRPRRRESPAGAFSPAPRLGQPFSAPALLFALYSNGQTPRRSTNLVTKKNVEALVVGDGYFVLPMGFLVTPEAPLTEREAVLKAAGQGDESR